MRYVFGDYEVDMQRDELRHGGILCPLESQAFKVLVYLMQHRNRVVSNAELLESLWPQQSISERTLSQRLRLLRKALGDSGRRQRVITTVPGCGYRFVATVEEQAERSPGHSIPMSPGVHVSTAPGGEAVGHHRDLDGWSLLAMPPVSAR